MSYGGSYLWTRHHIVTLFRGWTGRGYYVWSPFVTKLELRLRLSNLPYQTAGGSPRTAPTGKIPYVEVTEGDQKAAVGDSGLIAKHFEERGLIDDLNATLTPTSKAQDLAMRALMEDRLYFFSMRERWMDMDNFYVQRDKALEAFSYPFRVLIGQLIYRSHTQTLHGQGTGRFTAEEARKFREEIWSTLNGLLEESRRKKAQLHDGNDDDSCFWCLGGERPTECDTTVFGFINSALVATSGPESARFVRNLPAVMDYAGRIHNAYFPDYERW
ncbi:hypothetical protein NA57DRAFT_77905 [Rhizodiscina lignyota]|uniref:Thioredoxin-like fold domain-containing protein n=1 Tax=Rhizodiscina lignyota TaxID=1504668 RepID=A0A9P4ICU8_9PEZI|nr:hypothetical protein NA57DRAFT_77905 [Rhizodiscina lignyota]